MIGSYGDPLRVTVVNWLVAHALNHFGGRVGRERIAKPHTVILDSIAKLREAKAQTIEALARELVEAHMDPSRLAEKFPSLAGTRLLDFGSGNSYLGGGCLPWESATAA
ncbi:MAG: hypothetical protein IPJ28_10990 [Betaproteobacteria bacterium]|nr:hypothetical protein [Betaproteobacteria bacterium]